MRCKKTGEEVAIKFIERGDKVRGCSVGKEICFVQTGTYIMSGMISYV